MTRWRPRLQLALIVCSWHRRYHGHPKVIRLAWWPGIGVTRSDGICNGCAQRLRVEWRLPSAEQRIGAAEG